MTDPIRTRPDPAPAAGGAPSPDGTGSLRELLTRLAEDSRALVKQEVTLARLELQENASQLARNAVAIGVGAVLLVAAVFVLTAFAVIGLGRLLGGEYWLSTLIVGALLALIGGVSLLSGIKGLRTGSMKPTVAVASIQESGEWAKSEIEQLRHDLAT